jgi:hypothetical protein
MRGAPVVFLIICLAKFSQPAYGLPGVGKSRKKSAAFAVLSSSGERKKKKKFLGSSLREPYQMRGKQSKEFPLSCTILLYWTLLTNLFSTQL